MKPTCPECGEKQKDMFSLFLHRKARHPKEYAASEAAYREKIKTTLNQQPETKHP